MALLDDEDPLDLGDAASSSSEDARAEAERRLHSIAAKVAGSSPGGVLRLIGPLAEQPAGPRDDLEELQLRHISQVRLNPDSKPPTWLISAGGCRL